MKLAQALDGDWWWQEVIKPRWPQLREWDRVYDQSHVHHTMTILLLYGGIGAVLGCALISCGIWLPIFAGTVDGLAWGILTGLARYVVREAPGLYRPRHRASRWDGTLDVLVPMLVTLPWVLWELSAGAPWWSAAMLYSLGGACAYLYSFGRPSGVLKYGDESGATHLASTKSSFRSR